MSGDIQLVVTKHKAHVRLLWRARLRVLWWRLTASKVERQFERKVSEAIARAFIEGLER